MKRFEAVSALFHGRLLGRALYTAMTACFALTIALVGLSEVGADSACKAIEQSLQGHKKKLAAYMETLRDLDERRDAQRFRSVTSSVNQLSVIINHMEAELAACYGDGRTQSSTGMAHVKTDEEDEYAFKNCSDLQRSLLLLIRKINVLKRRENSIFSQLSSEEKAELRAAEEDELKVRAALKKRCATGKKSRRR